MTAIATNSRILNVIVLTVCLLISAGFGLVTAQETAPERVGGVMPMPGELIDADGFRLHLYCVGEGSPTVLLEAGGGDWSLTLMPLQEQIAEFTRVCVYDRASSGWSEEGPLPATSGAMADALYTMLSNSDESGPYVLAAHSYGGLISRIFANEHPDDVAGVVLIDARPPGTYAVQEADFPDQIAIFDRQIEQLESFLQPLRLTGLPPAQAAAFVPDDVAPPVISEALRQTYKQHLASQPYLEMSISLVENLAVSEAEAADTPLGDIPLIVLVASDHGDDMGASPEFEAAWLDLQDEQASISTHASLLIAEGSGHYIYLDRPQIVIDAIYELVSAAR